MTENTSPNQASAPLEHTIRLLYPFWLDTGCLDKAVDALCHLRHQGQQPALKKTWLETQNVPTLYREEILPLVTQVMFGFRQGTHRYLRIDGETLNYWFPRDGEMAPKSAAKTGDKEQHPHYPIKTAGEGIELFLSPNGVGLLSLTFESRLGDTKYLQAFNHRLSQIRRPSAYSYQVPLDELSEQTPPAPEDNFEQRLGARGGAFLLEELVDFLLAPLHDFGLQETQQQFSVYSVTRFDKHTTFTEADCQARLKPFLAALAHVEEATHQGSLGLREQMLNPKHWAAVGSLGAAHLIADQDPPHPFDEQRLSRSLYKYFVPYLCAFLQRLTLQRLLWETDQSILEAAGNLEPSEKLHTLHHDMLRFSVQGCFTEISSREVINQYYELTLQGLRVAQSQQLVQRALHDMASATTAAFQQKASDNTQALAKDVSANVGMLADVQRKVEWLEVFFVSYYATALVHYVGEGLFAETYLHWSAMLAPFIAGLLALGFIRPYASHEAQEPGTASHHKPAKQRRSKFFLITLALLTAAWMAAGYHCFPSEKHVIEGASFLCASGNNCEQEAAKGTI